MMYVEWLNEEENKLCLSRIPVGVFIQGLFTGHTSLLRWHENGKSFAYWVPRWKINFVKTA